MIVMLFTTKRLAGKRAEVMPSLMITDDIVAKSEWGNGVILGGNMVWVMVDLIVI